MIVKLHSGGVRELLALTPVLREFRARFPDDDLFVETSIPTLLDGNPDVTDVGLFFDLKNEQVKDLDMLPMLGARKHISETYSEAVLGDSRMGSFRSTLARAEQDEEDAEGFVDVSGRDACVPVCLSGGEPQVREGIIDAVMSGLTDMGLRPWKLNSDVSGLWGYYAAIFDRCRVFVGNDCDSTYVAMTTKVPMVALFSYRDPALIRPFRGGIPCELITPPKEVCRDSKVCLAVNGVGEHGIVQSVRCPDAFACRSWFSAEDILKTCRKVLGR